jgi:hypothetical protein
MPEVVPVSYQINLKQVFDGGAWEEDPYRKWHAEYQHRSCRLYGLEDMLAGQIEGQKNI